ncbi:g7880 [Coccomyxa viridis]|uniref:G7880 protein n=1 Tax=Coccomyxa viridis TaxID=1274662 RepID=A0ABP1G5I9_9CHLO
MLLVTRHAPLTLEEVGERYCFLRRHGDSIPHTVIHGSEGCGKYSLARAWLTECWGQEHTRLRRRCFDVRVGNRGPLTVNYFGSSVHFVLNLAMHAASDRAVLTTFVQDVC